MSARSSKVAHGARLIAIYYAPSWDGRERAAENPFDFDRTEAENSNGQFRLVRRCRARSSPPRRGDDRGEKRETNRVHGVAVPPLLARHTALISSLPFEQCNRL